MSDTSKTILIVDDLESLCEALAMEFEFQGFQTLMANSGKEAVEVLKDHSCDAVVSDIRMPNGDGLFLLKHIRSNIKHHLPVIFISAFSDLEIRDVFAEGVDNIFPKPFDFDLLTATLKRYLAPPEIGLALDRTDGSTHQLTLSEKTLDFTGGGETAQFGNLGVFIKLSDVSRYGVNDTVDMTFNFTSDDLKTLCCRGTVKWIGNEENFNGTPAMTGIGLTIDGIESDQIDKYFTELSRVNPKAVIPSGLVTLSKRG
jgi:CheY-like chemotaxis protein